MSDDMEEFSHLSSSPPPSALELGRQPSNFSNFDEEEDGEWGDLQEADELECLSDLLPKELKIRVHGDLEEIRSVPGFVAAEANFPGGTRICVRFGFPVAMLGLNREQALAWSLDSSCLFLVDLSFPPHYFNLANKNEISIVVGQAAQLNQPGLSNADNQIERFKLSWALENRIKKHVLSHLPNSLPPAEFNQAMVEEVCEISGAPLILALRAIRETRNRDQAVILLADQQRAQRLVSEEKVEAKNSSESSWLSYLFGHKGGKSIKRQKSNIQDKSANPSEAEAQLMKICNVSLALARAALNIEPTVSEAALLLTSPASRQQIESLASEASAAPGNSSESPIDTTSLYERSALLKEYSRTNFLVRVLARAVEDLSTINERCLLCENSLQFVGLKPSICGSDLCKMGFEQLGLAFDLATELRANAPLVDLLISLTVAAGLENRMHLVTPIGVEAVAPERGQAALNFVGDNKELDTRKLNATLNRIPSVSVMKEKAAAGVLLEFLNDLDPLIHPLIRWILASNRAHLRELSPEERLPSVPTPHQFVLLNASPEQEAKFQQLKSKCELKKGKGQGSIYTFHGSSTANWHSILRSGLKNMSNSKFMENGAAYGAGIYMAADAATSLGYCRSMTGWSKSMFSPRMTAMALCEVVNEVNAPNPYYVVPEEEKVTTRYIFIFPSDQPRTNFAIQANALKKELPTIKANLKVNK